jgi:hypothetical protein
VDLADPVTGNPLPLADNLPATVVVTTTKLIDNFYGGYEGFLSNIPITILPGTGESNHFNNDSGFSDTNIANLQPLPQLAIGFSGSGNIAAAALDIDYDETVLTSSAYIKIIQDVSQPDVILNKRIYSDNGNWKMRILFMSNTGTLMPSQLKCFIVWDKASIASGRSVADSTFPVTSAKFYNENGVEVTGISAVNTLLYQ